MNNQPHSPDQQGKSLSRQLALQLPLEPRFGREDFLVAPSNESAWQMIERWPDWPADIAILSGPEGAGKSHLGAIWAQASGAATAPAANLATGTLPELAACKFVLIEDAGPGALAERELFHLINMIREGGGQLLLTSRSGPAHWGVTIPDLLSRLRLALVVEIDAPDDELVRAVLVKLFHDRQLKVDISVVEFLALRIERSLGAARHIVELLDREALSRGRAVTRPMAAQLLRELESGHSHGGGG